MRFAISFQKRFHAFDDVFAHRLFVVAKCRNLLLISGIDARNSVLIIRHEIAAQIEFIRLNLVFITRSGVFICLICRDRLLVGSYQFVVDIAVVACLGGVLSNGIEMRP